MSAVYALETFHYQGVTITKGAKRDSVTTPAAVANPSKFTAAVPNAATYGTLLSAYLAVYNDGPELPQTI